MPQFDFVCFGILVWSVFLLLILFYFYTILNVFSVFNELVKFRSKKVSKNTFFKYIISINKRLLYNKKIKTFLFFW
uniref:ATPase subunit 8 n=1 Tax=Melosira undulata TaxID=2133757 RepID=A0A3G1PWD8_9STRA|nr:ATPase subunit 8 [Melosira undulata]AVR57554.1 ATPase subunit 8 [Melosira undulata]